MPDASLCCGAMHQHGGFAGEASDRLQETAGVLSGLAADAVLTVASGCGAQLVEHAGLNSPVRDISAFLAEVAWPESMLGVLRGQLVGLHQPCSLRNVMREDSGVSEFLARFDERMAEERSILERGEAERRDRDGGQGTGPDHHQQRRAVADQAPGLAATE